jgi:hypothetical protein
MEKKEKRIENRVKKIKKMEELLKEKSPRFR